MNYLTVDDIEIIHIQVIDASGGSHGVREKNRIASAVASMRQDVFGKSLYPSVFDKAAVLMRGIIADHPFIDGNKRAGMISALVFLNLNGIETSGINNKSLENFAVMVATEKLNVKDISVWLKKNSVKAG